MVYHSYSSYEAEDSKLFLFDLKSGERTELGSDWSGVHNAMNAHFSPDGSNITFMAISESTGSWDIFLCKLNNVSRVENITPDGTSRDEDPKFSPDGKKIVFKRDGRLAELVLETKSISFLTPDDGQERSMPYYSSDGSGILFSGGARTSSYIGIVDGNDVKTLYDRPDIAEYYPVTVDEQSFYFTAHYSTQNRHDQLYKGFLDGSDCSPLAFDTPDADFSDPCPIGGGWVIFSSTLPGGNGGYDLYIGNESSGDYHSLSTYSQLINTSLEELGATYCAQRSN